MKFRLISALIAMSSFAGCSTGNLNPEPKTFVRVSTDYQVDAGGRPAPAFWYANTTLIRKDSFAAADASAALDRAGLPHSIMGDYLRIKPPVISTLLKDDDNQPETWLTVAPVTRVFDYGGVSYHDGYYPAGSRINVPTLK